MQRGKNHNTIWCELGKMAIRQLPNYFIGTSGEPLEYRILFFVDLHGCVRLLIQICLTLTTLYPFKIPLRLI